MFSGRTRGLSPLIRFLPLLRRFFLRLGALGWIQPHQNRYGEALVIFGDVKVVILIFMVDLDVLLFGWLSWGKGFLALLVVVLEDG